MNSMQIAKLQTSDFILNEPLIYHRHDVANVMLNKMGVNCLYVCVIKPELPYKKYIWETQKHETQDWLQSHVKHPNFFELTL